MSASDLLLYCRAGFEKECAQELTALARAAGVEGFVKAKPASAYAVFHPHDGAAGLLFARHLDLGALVFPRQAIRTGKLVSGLPVGNRVAPIVAAAGALGTGFREMFLETPDTNEGKSLASLIRPLAPRLSKGLREEIIIPKWFKTITMWFVNDLISESEYLNATENLLERGILRV